jgi:hypothetical protein
MLLGIVRRGSGSVVRWWRAQIVLWSAQAMDVPAIARIAFTSEDRVREVIHNVNTDGFDSLDPRYCGRSATEIHVAAASAHQEARPASSAGSSPAVFHVVAVEVGGVLGG